MKPEQDCQRLVASDLRHLIHPLHDAEVQGREYVWVEGQGAVLRDAAGRQFIDALSGLWNVHVGHGRAELAEAAAAQMKRLAYASAYAGSSNLPAIELAERLAGLCYPGIERFFFTCGGAEANEAAFKTCRFYWKRRGRPQKTKIIARRLAYHGTTLAAMSATGMDWYWPMFEPRVPGFVHIEPPYPLWFEPTAAGQSPGISAAKLLEAAIKAEGPETVAAFIAEPVMGAGGVIVPPDDYFPRVRQICDQYQVLLIADEVITSFGRTGRWFALEHWDVVPDIVTFAKGITSGYFPLGGMGVSGPIAEAMDGASGPERWMHSYTYSAHPTGCAVALANLDIMEREGLVEQAAALGRRLLDRLRPLQDWPHVGQVRGLGLMAAVELLQSKNPNQPYDPAQQTGARVHAEMQRRGIVTRTVGDTILLAPPLVTPPEQIDRIATVVAEAIACVCGT